MSARYGHLTFDDGFLTATRPDGAVVRFTRRERALLTTLAGSPGRLFDRASLFEAMGGRGSDRNVDLVINQIRGKLGDTAAEKRFISTQYGEGYVWVARPCAEAPAPVFFTVGLLRGDEQAQAWVEALRATLAAKLGPAHRVEAEAPEARFRIEATLHVVGGQLHAAVALRDGVSGEGVTTIREQFAADAAPRVGALAAALCEAAWKHVALPSSAPGPTDPPLLVRLYAAGVLMDPTGAYLAANEAPLAELRARAPDDPALAIVFAMQKLGRMVGGLEPVDPESAAKQTAELEAMVMGALPAIRDDPVLALAAAKLLLATHRGHDALAEELARGAFTSSVAFASAFPMLAQLRAAAGDLAEAERLYDEGLALAEPGSVFEAYILVLKAQTLIAGEDWAGAEAIYDRLAVIVPGALPGYALLFLPPGDDGLARRLAPMVDKLSEGLARRMIQYQYYRSARYFRNPAHTANMMRGVLTHFVRRFGPGIASDALWRELPAELDYLRRARAAARQLTPPSAP